MVASFIVYAGVRCVRACVCVQLPSSNELCLHTVRPVGTTGAFHLYDAVGQADATTPVDLQDSLLLSEFKKEFGHGSTVLVWNGSAIRGELVATGASVCV